MKRLIGLKIVAIYFLSEAFLTLYNYFFIYRDVGLTISSFTILSISIGFLTSGVGLFLQKGWGRNFALFFNFYILFNGIRNLLSYLVVDNKTNFILKGLVSIFIAILIFIYLLRKSVKEKFTNSSISLIILGFSLSMYGITQRTGNILIDYFWLAMAIVGFSIVLKASRELKGEKKI